MNRAMQLYQCTLVMLKEFAGKRVPFNSVNVNVQWLQKCERKWIETRSVTTVGMHFRNIRVMINEAKKRESSRNHSTHSGKVTLRKRQSKG